MDRVYRGYSRLLDGLSRLGAYVCMASIAALIVLTGLQVFDRYVLNKPPVWAESTCMLLILIVAFIGGALCVREGAHLNLLFFIERIPDRWRRAVDLLVVLIILVFGVALLIGGTQTTLQVWSVRDPTLPISRGSYYLPLTVGGLLIVLFQIERLISALRETVSSPREME